MAYHLGTSGTGQVNGRRTEPARLILALLHVGADKGLFKKLHQDGPKEYYVIAAKAAVLYSDGCHWRVPKAAGH